MHGESEREESHEGYIALCGEEGSDFGGTVEEGKVV